MQSNARTNLIVRLPAKLKRLTVTTMPLCLLEPQIWNNRFDCLNNATQDAKNQHQPLAPRKQRCIFDRPTLSKEFEHRTHWRLFVMKRLVIVIVGIVMIPLLTGCADGPIRRWMRGSDCDNCNPPAAQPNWFSHSSGDGCNAPASNLGTINNQFPAGTANDPYGLVPPGGNPGPVQ